MKTTLKRLSLVVAALALIGTAWSSSAEARWYGGGWHGGGWHGGGWGWGGPAFVGGLALGAYAAAPYYGYGYGYPYGGGCVRNRVVGYTPYGRPIVRPVNVCY